MRYRLGAKVRTKLSQATELMKLMNNLGENEHYVNFSNCIKFRSQTYRGVYYYDAESKATYHMLHCEFLYKK